MPATKSVVQKSVVHGPWSNRPWSIVVDTRVPVITGTVPYRYGTVQYRTVPVPGTVPATVP